MQCVTQLKVNENIVQSFKSESALCMKLLGPIESESESDIRPSMVTHTRNLCSAFDPSKVHTHSSEHTHREHTPGAVGSHLCCGARGAVGGSVPCSRVSPQSWY